MTAIKPLQPITVNGYEVRRGNEPSASSALTVDNTILRGYAITWNTPSQPIHAKAGTFIERIHRGATSSALTKSGIGCLIEHKHEYIIGKTPQTLTLWEDEIGLAFECQLPDTQMGRDILTSIQRGDVSGCSFRFPNTTVKQQWSAVKSGQIYRDVYSLDLVEITLTAFPAYAATIVDVGKLTPASREFQVNMAKVNALAKALADDEAARVKAENQRLIEQAQAMLESINN